MRLWLLISLLGLSSPALAFRCGDRLIEIGNNKAEVSIKCGAPAWKNAWVEEIIENPNSINQRRISLDKEQWLYNFGPNRFLRFLTFEDGRLADISTGGRGYSGEPPTNSCKPPQFQLGMSSFEILTACGPPFFKDSRQSEQFSTIDETSTRLVRIHIDEWTYNLGPGQFLRILTFENGKLVDVRSGERGF